ncbi:MAG TPA: nuclear transport factor 2 family protein [Myxococcota bacterium]|jgi:hypothetical protein
MSAPADLTSLLARDEIHSVLLRYFRGIDRLDLELVRSCYHADAHDSHGGFSGTRDEFVAWVTKLLARFESTMHFAGNVLIEVEGDAAVAETYAIAFHRSREARPSLNLMVGVRYVDRFEKRAGAWKIARRACVTEWSRVDDEPGRFPIAEAHLTGKRDRSDVLYEMLAGLGKR